MDVSDKCLDYTVSSEALPSMKHNNLNMSWREIFLQGWIEM